MPQEIPFLKSLFVYFESERERKRMGGGARKRGRRCGSWGGGWGWSTLDVCPQNPASLYLGCFRAFFSPLSLSLLIHKLGINEAATEGSYEGRGRWNTPGSRISFPSQVPAPRVCAGVCVHAHTCAYACLVCTHVTWPRRASKRSGLSLGFTSGSTTNLVVLDKLLNLLVSKFCHL